MNLNEQIAKSRLKYKNLWDIWAEAREQSPPEDFAPVETYKNSPSTYFLKPEDMMSLLSAPSPYSLYMNKRQPIVPIDYSTSAFNLEDRLNQGNPNMILMASRNPTNRMLPIHSVAEEKYNGNYNDIPRELRRFIPQGIYEHEYQHFQDPRLNPNAQGISSREAPAMRAEDRYWDRKKKNLNELIMGVR